MLVAQFSRAPLFCGIWSRLPRLAGNRMFHSSGTAANQSDLVYEGELGPKIKMLKMLSLSTSTAATIMQAFTIHKSVVTSWNPILLALTLAGTTPIVLSPLIIHFVVARRYILDISCNPQNDTYNYTTFSLLGARKHIKFTPKDIKELLVPGILSTHQIHNRKVFIDTGNLQNIEKYWQMMSEDRKTAKDVLDFSKSKN